MPPSNELPRSRRQKPYVVSEWKTFRSLVSFSIKLRHQEDFQQVIKQLRVEWGVQEIGEWYTSAEIHVTARMPWALPIGNGTFFGVYPRSVDEADDQEAVSFEDDVGRLVRGFVDLKRFPPQYLPSAARATRIDLARFHPLGPFFSLCIRFDILSLPGTAGIARPPYHVHDPSAEGDLLYVPPEATKEEAHARIEQIFDHREIRDQGDEHALAVGKRTLNDLLRMYEAWRLRSGGEPYAKISDELVEMGLDDEPASISTISGRITRASEIWDLPEPSPSE